jgi:DNA-binding GntR family transcriptional regulator
METNLAPHSRLSEKAYEAIKEYILTSDIEEMLPGSRVDEKQLLVKLNMSRTPVREAINRLVAEGFLQVVPYKGVFVAKKTREEILCILMVRATLEGMAARLATHNFSPEDFDTMRQMFAHFSDSSLTEQRFEFSKANIQFHEFILERSRCGTLIEISRGLFDHIKLIRFRTSAFYPRLKSALAQHMKLVDVFEERDSDLAERLMREHIEESAHYVDEWEKIHGDSLAMDVR